MPTKPRKTTYKFGIPKSGRTSEHCYENVFKHEVHADWSRVAIAPKDTQVPLMLEIARRWTGPYGILYVLRVSRCENAPARYQYPGPCSCEELERFAGTFRDYFEGDGRHHIWFADRPSGSQLVYDCHDVVYSYGNDDEVMSLLKAKGFGASDVVIPSPHLHFYNEEYDPQEDAIMEYCEWIEFPLQEQHDNP